MDNYYALVGLTDEIQQAHFAATLLTKQAALWLHLSGIDLDRTKWSTLKIAIRDYFRPSDFKRCARYELASMRQKNSITGYIDAFKHRCTKLPSITDGEMLDRFMRGLSPDVQRELLKQDPPTFAAACQMAELLARLEAMIEAHLPSSNQNQNKNKQHYTNNPYHQGGFLPTDV